MRSGWIEVGNLVTKCQMGVIVMTCTLLHLPDSTGQLYVYNIYVYDSYICIIYIYMAAEYV